MGSAVYESNKSEGVCHGDGDKTVGDYLAEGQLFYCRACERTGPTENIEHSPSCEGGDICHMATGYVVGTETLDGKERRSE